jgi:hypothetical protein
MKCPTDMTEFRPSSDPPDPYPAARCTGIRDGMLLGLVLFVLVRSGEAMAGDQVAIAKDSFDPEVDHFRQWMPPDQATERPVFLGVPFLPDERVFSTTDFRPRKHTLFDSDPAVTAFADTPMLQGTTVWQRLSEYRARDGVRLLTLWHSRGNSVSLQADKRGDPLLQWTSRLNARADSTHGLLDQLFSVSLMRASNGGHNSARPASARPASAPTAQVAVPAAVAALK